MRRFAPALILLALTAAHAQDAPVFGTTVVIPTGLKGDVYLIGAGTASVNVINTLKPVGTIYTNSLEVPPQDFRMGFPGVTDRFEYFAVNYQGKFFVRKPGYYRFRLVADDGAMLFIDDQPVINNDGAHPPRAAVGHVLLTGGIHTIRVPYFQGPRYQVALMLEVALPHENKVRIFNMKDFKPPSTDPEKWVIPDLGDPGKPDPDLPLVVPPIQQLSPIENRLDRTIDASRR